MCEPAPTLLEYAAFVALFPHLIAGPIVRYTDIEDAAAPRRPRADRAIAASGSSSSAAGWPRSCCIADRLAPHVDRLFAPSRRRSACSAAWAAALGYSLQLYFDFSGYSDMAVGLALLLGFRFPQNFNSPYKATNISDFWRRWHMTLSRGCATTSSSRWADRGTGSSALTPQPVE